MERTQKKWRPEKKNKRDGLIIFVCSGFFFLFVCFMHVMTTPKPAQLLAHARKEKPLVHFDPCIVAERTMVFLEI